MGQSCFSCSKYLEVMTQMVMLIKFSEPRNFISTIWPMQTLTARVTHTQRSLKVPLNMKVSSASYHTEKVIIFVLFSHKYMLSQPLLQKFHPNKNQKGLTE